MAHAISQTAGFIISRALAGWGLTLALAVLAAASLRADAPPTTLHIQNMGPDLEGWPAFRLSWDAVPNATYRVQSATNVAPEAWQTVEVVTPANGTGILEVKGRSIPENSVEFYRLVLPQPQITAVEPAVVDVTGSNTPLYIMGQCLPTNALVLINGLYFTPTIVNTGGVWAVVSLNGLPPGEPWLGLTVIDADTSNVVATLPNAVLGVNASSPCLLEPPEYPPASPVAAWLSKKGYDYYQAQSQATFHVQEGKKGLNAVNVKLARMAGGAGGDGDDDDSPIASAPMEFMVEDFRYAVAHKRVAGGGGGGACVVPFSGEVQACAVDLVIPGRSLDFVWARTYRSRQTQNSSFGERWTHSYDVRCAQNSSGGVEVYDGTGRRDTFLLQADGTYTCPQFFREGTLTGGVFRLTFADTGYWEFNPFDGTAAAGKLARIQDRNGNAMLLFYGGGQLTQIVDDLGRTNLVAYDAGRVASVTDFSGRVARYEYDGNGDLVACVSPAVTDTPNGNDFPGGKTNRYVYSTGYLDDRENHLLLSVIDANGQTVRTHIYQHNQTDLDFLRCLSIQCWTNTPAVLSYLPQTPTPANQFAVARCIVNDPEGNVAEYFYDARNRLVRLQEFTGRATPEVPVTDTVNRPAGKLRADDPLYYETQWAWNNDSLGTKLVMDSHQIQCAYESDFDPATRARKRADLRVVRELAAGGVDLDGDGVADVSDRAWRYEYDPRFGSSGDRYLLGLKTYDPAKPYLVGDTAICNGGIWQKVDNSDSPIDNTRTRVNELENRLQGLGLLARAGNAGINETLPYATLHASRGKKLYVGNLPFAASSPAADESILANMRDRVQALESRLRNLGLLSRTTGGSKRFGIGITTPASPLGKKGAGAKIVMDRDTGRPRGFGFVTATTDPLGNVTTATYDANANQTQFARYKRKDGAFIAADFTYTEHGRLAAITNAPDGAGYRRVDTFTWSQGQLTQCVEDAGGLALTSAFEHDARGNGTRAIDPRGNDWLFTYNSLDQCVRAQTPVNLKSRCDTDFFYDANDNLMQCATELRDATDSLVGSQVNLASYDPLHRLTQIALAVDATHALTNRFLYDDNGQCVQVLGGDAVSGADPHQTLAYEYDERGFPWRQVGGPLSPVAVTNEFSYDSNGNLEKVSVGIGASAVGATFTVPHDGFGRPSGVTDPMGNQTLFFHDANDNLKVVRHFGETNDVPGSAGNLRLAESRCDYDELDRPVRVHALHFGERTQLPIGDGEGTTTFGYAPNGDCSSVTDDLGRTTTFAYDAAGRLSSVSSPGGKTVVISVRDAFGNATSRIQTDTPDLGGPPQVFSVTNVYDALNRCVRRTDSAGNNSSCSYDSLGRLAVQFNPREYKRTFAYDYLDRCTLAVADLDGDGGLDPARDIITTLSWSSSSGDLLAVTDSNTNTTSYAYDSLGNCTLITQADGTQQQLVWSLRSNLIQETDANGTVIANTYDLNDRIIHRDLAARFEAFTYDGCGRLTGQTDDDCDGIFTYDSLGNCVSETLNGLATTSTYDALGSRLALTYPGGRALAYTYDALNRCTGIFESGALVAGFDYAGVSRISRVTCGNGTRTEIAYDGLAGVPNAPGDHGFGQVSRIRHALVADSAVIDDRTFRYDPAQNKTARDLTAPFTLGGAAHARAFQYDAADRLVASLISTNGALASLVAYGLDRMGNRTNVSGAACSGNYAMDSASPPADYQMNQYTASACEAFSYDDNGNLTHRVSAAGPATYEYDYADRLVGVVGLDSGSGFLAPLASYTYDALGRRVSKTLYSGGIPMTTNLFLYDGSSVIEERENGAVIQSFVHLTGLTDESRENDPVIQMRQGTQDYYLHTDDQGNTLALTGTGGAVVERYDYDDYGAVTFLTSDGLPTTATASAYGNVYCWGGLRLDAETGLQNDDGGGYFEPQAGRAVRGKVKIVRDMGNSLLTDSFAGNNPWTGSSPEAMKQGTVKFFNETKGFGRVAGGGGVTITVKLIVPVAMDKGLRFAVREGGRHTPFHNKYRPQF